MTGKNGTILSDRPKPTAGLVPVEEEYMNKTLLK